MTYNEMYANAIAQLGETYLTPAYAQARENFFKVFETLAAAGCMGRVEDCRPELDNPEYIATTKKKYPIWAGWWKSSAGLATPG